MKLTFIGSGHAFTTNENYHSNMLLEAPNHETLLIDCGSDARHALHELNLSHRNINNVYISHLHADHIGGLEWLAFSSKFDSSVKSKPNLFVHEALAKKIWVNALSAGLCSLQDEDANITTYFNLKNISNNAFIWNEITFELIPTIHVSSNHISVPSYGLFFSANNLKIFITTDTQFTPNHYNKIYEQASIIFHDCETSVQKSTVHAPYSDLISLDPAIKSKMWLYHYNDGPLPDAKKDGFRGFVKKGQCFDFSNISTLL